MPKTQKFMFYACEKRNPMLTRDHPVKTYDNIEVVIYRHGTKRTGITCKKIFCYMRDLACRWLIVENTKIFQSCVKHF